MYVPFIVRVKTGNQKNRCMLINSINCCMEILFRKSLVVHKEIPLEKYVKLQRVNGYKQKLMPMAKIGKFHSHKLFR